MQLVTATVKYPAREPRDTKFGPRINAVVALGNGEEVRIWGRPGQEPLATLTRDQAVQVVQDHKGNWHLVEPDQPAAPLGFHPGPVAAPPAPQAPPAPAPVAAPAADPALLLADTWARCFARLVSQGVPPEVAGPGASTILIQLGRR